MSNDELHVPVGMISGQDTELSRLTTELACARGHLALQNRVLRMAARQQPLREVLDELALGIERQHPGVLCSIMGPDSLGLNLVLLSAPSLPAEYCRQLPPVRIGPGVGSCGSAAFSGERVVVTDIANHPDWVDFRELALAHGLRSCWSQPFVGYKGVMLGVFAIYRNQPGEPSAADLALIETCADLACLVLEYYQTIGALALETSKYQSFLQTSPDGVVVLDMDGHFIEASDGFLQQIGLETREELQMTRFTDWDADHDEASILAMFRQLDSRPRLFETRCRRVGGELWNAEISISLFESGGQRLIWASGRDVSERKLLEAELHRRATTDSLTCLPNRQTLLEALAQEFSRSRRYQRPLSVLMLDIDHFKWINDSHGHAAGDRVLQAVAAALQGALRSSDCVGRIGGEEFALLLPETGIQGAFELAERLRLMVARLDPVLPDGTVIEVRCSIGCSALTGLEQDSDELLCRADRALYRAKRAGRNRVMLDE